MAGTRERHVVAVAVTDGAPVFELAVPCEVFGIDRRDLVDPWYELRLCAVEPGPVRLAGGLQVAAPHSLDDLVAADTVVVAACARHVQAAPPPALIDALREAHRRGKRIVTLCTGAYILAATGLLDGRQATLHWMSAPDVVGRFPQVEFDTRALYTDDGDILTSAGTGATIDLCLHVVRNDFGAAVANEVARRMVVPPHREGGQTQYTTPQPRPDRIDSLAPVLEWARARLHEPLTVPRLARRAHLSERTFARRFHDSLGTTPLQWLLQERVRLAQELLETTDETIESISTRTGFGTAANLRHHFRRITTVSPQSYRQAFRHRGRGGDRNRAAAAPALSGPGAADPRPEAYAAP